MISDLRLTFDKDRKSFEDILTTHGFFQCMQHTLRVAEKGLIFLGVPCNSFSWMSSSQHDRGEHNGWMGNVSNFEWVGLMNVIATRAAIFMAVGIARRIYFMVENPDRSSLPNYPYFDYLLQICHTLDRYAGFKDRTQEVSW